MRDVLLLRVSQYADFERVLRRSLEILDVVYRGEGPLERDVWEHREARLAMIQSSSGSAGDRIAMHRTSREAFAYSGFVSAPQYDASALCGLLSRTWSGKLALEDSPGGIAAYFHADARRRRCHAWSSHAGVEGVFLTRGEDCIAIGNSPLASHLVGTQREVPSFSRQWARRVLLGGCTLWDDTPFEKTVQAPPRSLLILHRDDVRFGKHPVRLERRRYDHRDPAGIDALNAAAGDAISVLRRWPRGEMQLSGGKDSRYVGALLCRAGLPARYITHAGRASGEGAAAAAVARALGVEHQIPPAAPGSLPAKSSCRSSSPTCAEAMGCSARTGSWHTCHCSTPVSRSSRARLTILAADSPSGHGRVAPT